MTPLDAAFTLGLLLNLTKAADLFLLESQKRWIDVMFRRVTSRLKRVDALRWFVYLQTGWIKKTVAAGFIVILVTVAAANYFSLVKSAIESRNSQRFLSWCWFFIGTSWAVKAIRAHKGLASLFEALPPELKLRDFLQKYLSTFAFFGFASLLQVLVLLIGKWLLPLDVFYSHSGFLIFCISLLDIVAEPAFAGSIGFLTMLQIWALSYLAVLILPFLFSIAVVSCSLLIYTLQAISRRIVQYNKGVYAAIVLIATVALGMLEVIAKMVK